MTEQERLLAVREEIAGICACGMKDCNYECKTCKDLNEIMESISRLSAIAFAAGEKEGMREMAEKIKQALEETNRIAAVENVLELEGK